MDIVAIGSWLGIIAALGTIVGWFASSKFRAVIKHAFHIPNAISLGLKMANKGVCNFYSCRNELNRTRGSELFESIKGAKESIGIVAISLQQSIAHQNFHKALKELMLKNPQLTVSISLVSPSSPLIEHLADASGRDPSDLRSAIRNSIARLQEVQAIVNTPAQERLAVQTCAFHYFSTLVAVDVPVDPKLRPSKNAFFLIEHSLYDISFSERYTFELGRPGSYMFEKALKSYRAIMSLETIADDDAPAV